jgi:hypothetical protein
LIRGGIDSFGILSFEDDNAFKQALLRVVFIDIVFIFFPVIVILAHKAVVALVGMPSIQPPFAEAVRLI